MKRNVRDRVAFILILGNIILFDLIQTSLLKNPFFNVEFAPPWQKCLYWVGEYTALLNFILGVILVITYFYRSLKGRPFAAYSLESPSGLAILNSLTRTLAYQLVVLVFINAVGEQEILSLSMNLYKLFKIEAYQIRLKLAPFYPTLYAAIYLGGLFSYARIRAKMNS